MIRVRITSAAQNDLHEIRTFVAADKPVAARRLLQSLHDKLTLLAKQPNLGEVREDLLPGLRCFTAGAYVIHHRLHPDAIEILRIVHSARDERQFYQP